MAEKIEFTGHLYKKTWEHDTNGLMGITLRLETRGTTPLYLPDGEYRITLDPVEPEVKPCPFCGGDAEIVGSVDCNLHCVGEPFYSVHCTACGVVMANHTTRSGAVNAWNRRGGR